MESVYSNESKLINFTRNFLDRLAGDPGAFDADPDRVAEYAVTRERFIRSYDVANAEPTRTRANITLKDENKRRLVSSTRALIRQLQAWPQLTDAQRRELRITVADRTKTPLPPPTAMPQIELVQAVRHTVRLRVANPDGGRRRPAGTAGANVFYAVSDAAPASPGAWASAGLWTRGPFDVTFPLGTPAGATVWLSAAYYNPRGEYGPMADAVTTNLPGGQAARRAA